MTPSEQYTQERAEAEHLIRQYAPLRLQDQLVQLIQPIIVSTARSTRDEQIPVGSSKFGGVPDVSANFEWPKWEGNVPLNFLAQINLADVNPFDIQKGLPTNGLLSFFYGLEDAPSEAIYRIFWSENKDLRRFSSPPTMPEFKTCHIDFSARLEMANDFEYLDWEDFQEVLESSMPEINSSAPRRIRMLGLPDTAFRVCYSSMPECRAGEAAPSNEYRVLLQVGSFYIPDMCWGDAGILSFVMHKDDLVAKRFDKVHLHLDMG